MRCASNSIEMMGLSSSLTDGDFVVDEEGVHLVDVPHELGVAEGEVRHVPARLGRGHQLDQR